MGKGFDVIKESKFIVLAGHISPDGDCVGACFAAAMALEKLGKKAVVLLEEFAERYSVIPGSEFLYKGGLDELAPDLFIALDCGDKYRLGVFTGVFDKAPVTVCVDHHISNKGFADHNHIEPDASSTCEIVYKLIEKYITIDSKIAAALYAGIVYDTGGFAHNSTGETTHTVVSRLMSYKIPFSDIYNALMNVHSVSEVYGLKKAIENIVMPEGKRYAYSSVSLEEMAGAGITHKDFEGVVEYLMNIRGMRLAFFAYEKPECQIKLSLRSKEIDVSEIAAKFGGGGHECAAGATINARLGEAVAMVLQAVEERL